MNCEIMTWAKFKSYTFNLLSHPGAPPLEDFDRIVTWSDNVLDNPWLLCEDVLWWDKIGRRKRLLVKVDGRYGARGKKSRISVRFLTWVVLTFVKLRQNWVGSIWGKFKSKFSDKLSLRCLLDIQVKRLSRQLSMCLKVRARNKNLRVIRMFIDHIYSYGTGRVVSID